MSNIVEELLKIDLGEVEIPKETKKIYLKKLKREFEFECVALDAEKANEIRMKSIDLASGTVDDIDMFKLQAYTVIEGCKNVFKNKDLMKHFNAPTPIELVRRLLLDGELTELSNTITELSSYQEVKDNEIKN
ncbi:MAG TPA: XkdN-like protein [Romboutsia timonensis]|uniref:XkdN-like protein n=1 Tax=Romboutsia timonensis TaxID=1776391 RepID=A0A921N167_9FIRM|nr:XkdN-like protein [Romboutsia timonensis]